MKIPIATYRLQLNKDFTFGKAEALLDYFVDLGISHLYLSPINTAPPESMHNYDVWDYNEINPVLGGREGFESLVSAAKSRGLGIIIDFVPNHMGIDGLGNRWWRDVLKNGPDSEFAGHFDIRWDNGKVRIPVLGDFGVNVLQRGEVKLVGDVLRYFERTFPIAPGTMVEGDANGTLSRQHYWLTHWRHGSEQINYRRFFEVNTLAGVAVERPETFAAVHELIGDLVRDEKIDGLRIDHIDGLACPGQYLRRLREKCGDDFYLVVEKILGQGERLPESWPVQGTTGYDFLIELGRLFIASKNGGAFDRIYREVTGERRTFEDIVFESKIQVMRTLFYSEFHNLLKAALEKAQLHPLHREISPRAMEQALEMMIALLPVYRTYIHCGETISSEDRSVVKRVREAACKKMSSYYHAAIEFLAEIWQGEFGSRLQQFTGPIMAKGVEDTAFYRYHRLIGLNEVGGEPDRFGVSIAEFHARCRERAEIAPYSLLATSTHDTKQSEDVRARLAVLSEIPHVWEENVKGWLQIEPGPDVNFQYRLYQTLVGSWPLGDRNRSLPTGYVERITGYVKKASREAKVHTSWVEPNEAWEQELHLSLQRLLTGAERANLRRSIGEFVARIAPFGFINALSQTLLKLTCPGVPDIYQGNEVWDFSLVDPDNRRPVDYRARANPPVEQGGTKRKIIRDILKFRKRYPELFTIGEYRPLEVRGELAEHCFAFERAHADLSIIITVPLFLAGLGATPEWRDTKLSVPPGAFLNLFTGQQHRVLDLREIFAEFPVAALIREGA